MALDCGRNKIGPMPGIWTPGLSLSRMKVWAAATGNTRALSRNMAVAALNAALPCPENCRR